MPSPAPEFFREKGPWLISGAIVLDPEDELHRPVVSDVLVEGQTIVAVGDEARLRGHSARRFDAGGFIVTPGFINAHSHSHDTLLRGLFEQMTLENWGAVAFPFNWPPRLAEEISVRTRAHAVECLLGGMTTVQDMVTIVGFEPDHACAVADAYSISGISALVAPQYSSLSGAAGIPFVTECFPAQLMSRLGSDEAFEPIADRLRAIFSGVTAPGVSWALGPVQPQLCSDAVLNWTARQSAETGMRVFTHLYETRAEAVLARHTLPADHGSAVNRLIRTGFATDALTIAHGVWISAGEIDALGQRGVNLATNPVTNLKLMNGFAPLRRYRDARVDVGLGCDNSSASDAQNIFQAMKHFALIWGMQSPAGDQSAAAEAFRAATVGGAKVLGMEGQVGRIAPGFRADLVFIDATGPAWRPINSVVRQLVYGESGRGVEHVMAAGSFVVANRKSLMVDEASLIRDITRVQEAIQADLPAVVANASCLTAAYDAVAARVAAEPLNIDARILAPFPD